MYTDLIATFAEMQNNIASFRKVVLHMHSPDSYDYRRAAGVDRSTAESLFMDAINDSMLDIVAITDHMKCDLACRLSTTSDRVCILPGMEINLRPSAPWDTFRIHILAVFPERHAVDQVCKILPEYIPSEGDRRGREEITDHRLSSFVNTVHTYGGLCIAAHINDDRGVRRAFRQLGRDGIVFYDPRGEITSEEEKQISEKFKEWMLSAGFDAIEVKKETDKKHYRWIGDEVSIPVLLTNDAHCTEDIAREQRITHIKMTSTCFDGLKKALQFPDTRVRFPSDMSTPPSPCILGLEVSGGGFFKKLQVAFSNNLTCLIGPRGSGKSTIIEALRYVFGYNKTLDEIQQSLAEKVRELQRATLTNCVIRVVYRGQNGQLHILEATYDPEQDYATKVYTEDGEEIEIHDVEKSGLYPLRLFGWSEIETLGREANRQRELLDRLIPGLSEKLEQRKELRSELAEKRKEIESAFTSLQSIVDRSQGEIRRYREYKARFNKLNTAEMRSLFAELDITKSKAGLLDTLKANAQNWLDTLKDAIEIDILSDIETLAEGSEELGSWWIEKKTEIGIVDRQANVRNEIGKGTDILKNLIHELGMDIQKIKEEIQDKSKKIRDEVSEEADRHVDANLRSSAGDRFQRVEKLRQEYTNRWDLLQNLINEWKNAADNLFDLHQEISAVRKKRMDEIEESLNLGDTEEITISLRFDSGRDRDEFENHLRDGGFLSRELHGNYKAKDWPKKIANACSPIELAEAILTKNVEQLVKKDSLAEGGRLGMDDEIAEKLIETFYPFDQDEDADIPTVDADKLKKLLSMAEIEWDDLEGIRLNGKPVEHLSPGQRSSAMLPLIALVEDVPLVIDQPEDNLDNRLVGKTLVNILAALKEKRQIIVATHNPNIVVSGDAEQVIVLDALGASEGVCTQSGSIDEEEIVKEVMDLMEGGREAFLARGRRYGLND